MHTIRLREPWLKQALQDGSIQLTRVFHRPTGLDASNRVCLHIEDIVGGGQVTLNNRLIGHIHPQQNAAAPGDAICCPARFDITSNLQPTNLLSIQLPPLAKESTAPLGPVSLEIE
jgi:hypothetical protein